MFSVSNTVSVGLTGYARQMGAVHFSLDRRLVEALQGELPLRLLVETGTFEGDAVGAVADLFDEVQTVELSPAYAERAKARFASNRHVVVHHGDSAQMLAGMRHAFAPRSTLYWLDAHWCVAEHTVGEQSQCPLLEELLSIGHLNDESVILIDDARLFLAPPPAPHESSQWPRFQQILDRLVQLSSRHEVMVVNDVIAFFPQRALAAMHRYARECGIDWLFELQRRQLLERETVELQRAADERLAVLRDLADVAEERLAALQATTRVAEERLELIQQLHARANPG
jgi:hypothetical protein